jgi:hypothetical protein
MEEFTERRKSKRPDASAPHRTYREKAVPGLVTMAQWRYFKTVVWNIKKWTIKWQILRKNCLQPEWLKNYVKKAFYRFNEINSVRFWRKWRQGRHNLVDDFGFLSGKGIKICLVCRGLSRFFCRMLGMRFPSVICWWIFSTACRKNLKCRASCTVYYICRYTYNILTLYGPVQPNNSGH